jgi:hypothetical protein
MLVVGPAAAVLLVSKHHRPAVVDHAAVQQRLDGVVHFLVIALDGASFLDKGVGHPFVDGVAAGDHDAAQGDRVADFQAADGFVA